MNPLFSRTNFEEQGAPRQDTPLSMTKDDYVFGQELGRGAVGKVSFYFHKKYNTHPGPSLHGEGNGTVFCSEDHEEETVSDSSSEQVCQ